MRYTPAALALALLAAVTASVGQGAPSIPLDPRSAALVAQGRAALAGGDANSAIDAFEAALAVQPGHVAIYLNLAEATRQRDGGQHRDRDQADAGEHGLPRWVVVKMKSPE